MALIEHARSAPAQPQAMSPPRRRTSPLACSLELASGLVLLGGAALAGAIFVRRPWENRLDVLAYSLVPARPSSPLYLDIARLGSTGVFLAGVAVLTVLALFRDRARALACAVGPLLAVLVTERVAKPLVARHGVLGGDSYPSGTVTAVAALVTGIVLVSPRLLRPLTTVVGLGVIVAVGVAVVGLRWHYGTDAVGGLLVGCGAVFSVDALAHVPGLVVARLHSDCNNEDDSRV